MRSSFLYALGFFLIFLLFTVALPPHSNRFSYGRSLTDKHRRLEALSSPKLIIVGGSNLAFGLNSALIEKTFALPTVNMGLSANFGLRYALEEIKDQIDPWDIILIVPEYASLNNLFDGKIDIVDALHCYPYSSLHILKAAIQSPKYAAHLMQFVFVLPATKWKAFLSLFDQMLRKGHFEPELLDPKFPLRYYFDRQGDFFFHFFYQEAGKENWHPYKEIPSPISDEAANFLEDFNTLAIKRRARVIMLPPPLPYSSMTPEAILAPTTVNWPGRKLSIPILARPERYIFPDSDFFELPYHLNLTGRTKRTALVIEDLRKYFNTVQAKYY